MIADLPAFLAAEPAGRLRSRDDAQAFAARMFPPRPELAGLAAALDPNPVDAWSVAGACPDCGRATSCGYRSADSGKWLVWPPGRCAGCRASALGAAVAARDAGRIGPALAAPDAPAAPPSPGGAVGHPRLSEPALEPLSAAEPERPEPGKRRSRGGQDPEPAPVQVRGGALYVNGAAVADGITPADVTVMGRRVFVRGRQVAELAA